MWWALQDLNLRPTDYESAALTAELRARTLALIGGANGRMAAKAFHPSNPRAICRNEFSTTPLDAEGVDGWRR